MPKLWKWRILTHVFVEMSAREALKSVNNPEFKLEELNEDSELVGLVNKQGIYVCAIVSKKQLLLSQYGLIFM